MEQVSMSSVAVTDDARTLQRLLEANLTITGNLTLPSALRRITESACELTDARYGALTVTGPDQQVEFIHVGIDADGAQAIGHFPKGIGLLGALVAEPQVIRLEDVRADPRSVGFPEGHPAMRTFLGVAIRVWGTVVGSLYVCERAEGRPFTGTDEAVIIALATTAGVAIVNARLFEESRSRQQYLAASGEITRQLLSGEGEEPLRVIARLVLDISDADVVTVVLPTPDPGRLMVEVAVGKGAAQLTALTFPGDDSLAGQALRTGESEIMNRIDAREDPPPPMHLGTAIDVGAAMVVPLAAFGRTRGALTVARRAGRPGFTSADLEMVTTFANHASVALELDDARTDQQRMMVLEDRHRIARDLHDHVIQRLFAIGLSVQSVAATMPSDTQANQLESSVRDIDATIRQIRTSIFELTGPLLREPDTLRSRVLHIVDENEPALGCRPELSFAGPVDFAADEATTADIVAVFREALANVARHARASAVAVEFSATLGEFILDVIDNGVGMQQMTRRSGLTNLRERAEHYGGSLDIRTPPSGGTHFRWSIPLSGQARTDEDY